MNRYTITYTDGKTDTVDADDWGDNECPGWITFVTKSYKDGKVLELFHECWIKPANVRGITFIPLTDEQLAEEARERADKQEQVKHGVAWRTAEEVFGLAQRALEESCWTKNGEQLVFFNRELADAYRAKLDAIIKVTLGYMRKLREAKS